MDLKRWTVHFSVATRSAKCDIANGMCDIAHANCDMAKGPITPDDEALQAIPARRPRSLSTAIEWPISLVTRDGLN